MSCDKDCLNCKYEKCIHDIEDEKRSYNIIHGYADGFGNRLRYALDSRGMKHNHLAKITGLTAPTISTYVNGQRTPRADHIVVICKALHISADWLLGMVENEND
jgi:antitoxin component HigA of HigAB toxin-antitoxin module